MKTKTVILGLSAVVMGGSLLVLPSIQNGFVKAEQETHFGKHYTLLAPTDQNSGVKEYWVCCDCHEHFLTKPAGGAWEDAGVAATISDPTDDRYIEKAPSFNDLREGWATSYDATTGRFVYTNKTNYSLRMFKDLSISGKGILTFDYYNKGLGCTDGATQVSNWVAGLVLSSKIEDITPTSGPYMVIGKTCGEPKRITSIFVDSSTSWNNPTGTDIVIEDGVMTTISLAYDLPNKKITAIGNGCICTFNIPAVLQGEESLHLGLYGSSMKAGKTYGEVSISNIVNKVEEPASLDASSGWTTAYDNHKNGFAYVNNTAGAIRTFPSMTISGKGTLTYDYYENGIGHDGTIRGNWVAGLMFSKASDLSSAKGPSVVVGKTPMVAKRITSVAINESGNMNYNNPTGTNITFEDGEFISLTIAYDISAGTFTVTGDGKTSNFKFPDTLKGADTLYLGLYGSTMDSSNPYGQVVVSNINITPAA